MWSALLHSSLGEAGLAAAGAGTEGQTTARSLGFLWGLGQVWRGYRVPSQASSPEAFVINGSALTDTLLAVLREPGGPRGWEKRDLI